MEIFNLLNETTVQCIANEAYYGKTRGLQKLRGAFQDVYNLALQDLQVRNDNSKEFKYFSKCIEEEFGFKRVLFGITPESFINAYTYPVIVKRVPNGDSPIIETSTGVKFNNSTNYNTTIYVTQAMMKVLSSDEIFAIILHEIGHSFSSLVYIEFSKNVFTRMGYTLDNMFTSIIDDSKNEMIKNFDELDLDDKARRIVDKEYAEEVKFANSKFGKFIETSKGLLGIAWGIYSLVSIFKGKILLFRIMNGINSLANTNNNIRKRGVDTNLDNKTGNEYFSDSFAAMYGYSVELTSALTKIDEDGSKSYSINSIINGVSQLLSIVNSNQVHPDSYQRAMSLKAHLVQEIEKNTLIDSNTKKELESQIKEISEYIEKLTNPKNYNIFSKLYTKIVLLKKKSTKNTVDNIDYSFGLKR